MTIARGQPQRARDFGFSAAAFFARRGFFCDLRRAVSRGSGFFCAKCARHRLPDEIARPATFKPRDCPRCGQNIAQSLRGRFCGAGDFSARNARGTVCRTKLRARGVQTAQLPAMRAKYHSKLARAVRSVLFKRSGHELRTAVLSAVGCVGNGGGCVEFRGSKSERIGDASARA